MFYLKRWQNSKTAHVTSQTFLFPPKRWSQQKYTDYFLSGWQVSLARGNEEKDGLDEKQGEAILSSEIKMSTLHVT